MIIKIVYESKWGNSFLDGIAGENRNYAVSLSKMNNGSNKNNAKSIYKERDISINTVYGLLYRFLGARKPLFKMLEEINNEDVLGKIIDEDKISFNNEIKTKTDELVFLRSTMLSNDQNSYSGIPDESILLNNGIQEIFSIFEYSRAELINYIVNNNKVLKKIKNISIIELSEKLENARKDSDFKINDKDQVELLSNINNLLFGVPLIVDKSNLMLVAFNKMSIDFFSNNTINEKDLRFLSSKKTFAGISLNGNSFTLKDFMKKFSNSKIVYGNPYKTDFWVENPSNGKNMKFNKGLTKQNGVLTIDIDIDYDESLELKKLIDFAGVPSFYLGKKGFAYIDEIII